MPIRSQSESWYTALNQLDGVDGWDRCLVGSWTDMSPYRFGDCTCQIRDWYLLPVHTSAYKCLMVERGSYDRLHR